VFRRGSDTFSLTSFISLGAGINNTGRACMQGSARTTSATLMEINFSFAVTVIEFQFICNSNSKDGDSVYGIEIDSVLQADTFTYLAGVTGRMTSPVIAYPLAIGQDIQWRSDTVLSTGGTIITQKRVDFRR